MAVKSRTASRNLTSSYNVVLSCLPSDEAVLNICQGQEGIFANAHRNPLVIDMSTVFTETLQQLSRLGSERGIDILDVTISGSTPVAEKGLLTSSVVVTNLALRRPSRFFVSSRENIFIWGRAAPEQP
jgi:3-hydroxyisobutyrate dehydrogenase